MKKAFTRDKADAVLIWGIISIFFLVIVAGFGIDLTKNWLLAGTYNSMVQTSSDTAVKTINSKGSLTDASASKLISEFEKQNNDSLATNEVQNYNSELCTDVTVGGEVHKAPYYVISFSEGRGNENISNSRILVSEAGGPLQVQQAGKKDASYKTITVDVYNSRSNIFLGMAGITCQQFKSHSSSVAYASDADL
jgi:hypothetical protein